MRLSLEKTLRLALLGLLVILPPSTAPAMNFELLKIGEADWIYSMGLDVNSRGDVVGQYSTATGSQGFLSSDGSITDIIPAGWDNALAFTVSDNGNVAGVGSEGGTTKGFLYSGGSYTAIAPPGFTSVNITGVNDSGQTCGSAFNGTNSGLLCNGGSCTTIMPPGWTNGVCNAINESGQLACYGTSPGGSSSFLYDDGTFTTIHPPGWASSYVRDINDAGQVVGVGASTDCFIYDHGTYTFVPPPPDALAFACTSIDQKGNVAGQALYGGGEYRIAVWSDGEYFTSLPPQGSTQFSMLGTMRNGLFAGYTMPSSKAYAVRVTPAPDLKAGPYDGPGVVGPGAALSITANLSAGVFRGERGDFWLIAQQPSGTYSFDARSQSWRPGIFPAAQGPLKDFAGKRVFSAKGLPAGMHTFTLAVDLKMNGRPDAAEWYDDILYFFVP